MDTGEVLVGKLVQTDTALGLCDADTLAGRLVSIAERYAFADQPFSQVSGQGVACRSELAQTILVEGQRCHQTGQCRQQQSQLLDRVHQRLLVLLEVTVVSQRLSLQRGHEPCEITNQTTGLTASQLCHVRVLLLRHDGRTSRPGISQSDVAVLRGGPVDDFLCQTRHVHGNLGEDESRLRGEITRRGAVNGVVRGRVEAELLGDGLRIQVQRGSCQRARAVRGYSQTTVEIADTVEITQQRMRMCQQLVRQQHRLSRLRVSLARHDGIRVCLGLSDQGADQVRDIQCNAAHGIAQPHAEQGCHLVIAGTTSAQATTDLRADAINQTALHSPVDVLIRRLWTKLAGGNVATELIKACNHGVKVGIAEQPASMQHSGVGLGRKNVVRREHPVKMGGLAQCGHRLGRATGKAAAPQGAFVGTVLFDHRLFQ